MGGELSTCQVESCEPQTACRIDPSITPCGYFPHPGEPQQSRHGDIVWPLCDRARRGGTCGAYLLSARGKSEDGAQLDAGRRELELWLQAVVGHECKEAPWAQVQEDYWLQGHSSAAARGPEGASGPESLELASHEQRAAAAQPPSSPSNARPASGGGSPAPKSPPTLVNIVALSQAQSEEKEEEASNSGPPTASSSEATGSLQVEDAARGPGQGVPEEEAGGDGEASTEGNEEPASPVALETEAVLPQEVYGLSLYHISSVTPPRMRPEGRSRHCRGPPWPRPDGSPWPRPDGRARKQEARKAEACEPRPRPKPEACEAKQRPPPPACEAKQGPRPEARSAKPAEAQEPKARGESRRARPRGGKANELLLW